MVSNKSKGDKYETEVMKQLQCEGYLVNKSPRTMKRVWLPGGKIIFVSQANDYFGLFDLVAKKGGITRWIQCKWGGIRNVSTARKNIKEFKIKHCCEHETVEIWAREPRKKSVIHHYDVDEEAWYKEDMNEK